MLVLNLKCRQTVSIGENVIITILSFKDQSVRIGFEAPKEISILRDNAKLREPGVDTAKHTMHD